MPWFQRKRAVAEQEQHKLWKQARMKTDIQKLISKMSELEIVDSFNAIERQLLGEMQVNYPPWMASYLLPGCAFIFCKLQVYHVLSANTIKCLLLH